jgi:hypothetical protein
MGVTIREDARVLAARTFAKRMEQAVACARDCLLQHCNVWLHRKTPFVGMSRTLRVSRERERGITQEGRKKEGRQDGLKTHEGLRKIAGRQAGRQARLRQEEARRKEKEGKSGKERQEGTKEESQEH